MTVYGEPQGSGELQLVPGDAVVSALDDEIRSGQHVDGAGGDRIEDDDTEGLEIYECRTRPGLSGVVGPEEAEGAVGASGEVPVGWSFGIYGYSIGDGLPRQKPAADVDRDHGPGSAAVGALDETDVGGGQNRGG